MKHDKDVLLELDPMVVMLGVASVIGKGSDEPGADDTDDDEGLVSCVAFVNAAPCPSIEDLLSLFIKLAILNIICTCVLKLNQVISYRMIFLASEFWCFFLSAGADIDFEHY